MSKRQHILQREGMPNIRMSQHEVGASSSGAGGCAGGHRVSGGAPGNGHGHAAASLGALLDTKSGWEAPAIPLMPEQICWLSSLDLLLILQNFSCDLSDVSSFLGDLAYKKQFELKSLQRFFRYNYMQCLSLLSELQHRLNSL